MHFSSFLTFSVVDDAHEDESDNKRKEEKHFYFSLHMFVNVNVRFNVRQLIKVLFFLIFNHLNCI